MSTEEGPLVTQAYVCNNAGEKLTLQDITLPPLVASQVELGMKYCGLCHTDIHMKGKSCLMFCVASKPFGCLVLIHFQHILL